MIDYAKIALRLLPYAAALLMVGAVLWYRGEAASENMKRISAESSLKTAIDANKMQDGTITQLRTEIKTNQDLLQGLSDKLDAINANVLNTGKRLADLERSDPSVKAYMDSPIPPALRGVRRAAGGAK